MVSSTEKEMNASISKSEDNQTSQFDSLVGIVEVRLDSFIKRIIDFDKRYAEILLPQQDSEDIIRTFIRLINTLKIIQAHFTFLVKVLRAAEPEEEIANIKKEFHIIAKFYENILKRSDIRIIPLNQVLDTTATKLFRELDTITQTFFHNNDKKKFNKNKENISFVEIMTYRLKILLDYLPGLVNICQEDIFAHCRSSLTWKNLCLDVRFKWIADRSAIKASIKPTCELIALINAIVLKMTQLENKKSPKVLSKTVGILSGIYYITQKQKAQARSWLLHARHRMESVSKVWGVSKLEVIKGLVKLNLPPVEYDKKIYLPKLFPLITKDSILKEYDEGTLNNINICTFEAPDLIPEKEKVLKDIFVKSQGKVRVRILASKHLVIKGERLEKLKSSIAEIKKSFVSAPKPNFHENFHGVVIHIHGGGFVAGSSALHRNYLIRWANALNMVIFSIDYRLATVSPYPGGLDDVWQAYNWIVNYSESILGIPLDRVVLAGDSAGGNLALSLAFRTIKEGMRIPDGLLLAYPALNLFPYKVVPSYFYSVDDLILPYSVLKLCIKAYIPEDCHPEADPFLSPVLASDELLSKLPAVRIITGTDDPLHDDNWKFLYRLQKLKKNAKMTVFEGIPHGFLSLDKLVSYELLISESIGQIRELFYSVEEKL